VKPHFEASHGGNVKQFWKEKKPTVDRLAFVSVIVGQCNFDWECGTREIRQRGFENKKGVTITRNAFICCC
jgi:hypothetical protein